MEASVNIKWMTDNKPLKKQIAIFCFTVFIFLAKAQDNNRFMPQYHLIVENGFGINYSDIYHDKNLTAGIQPSAKYQRGYYFALGVERTLNHFSYTLKAKRVSIGNMLNFVPRDTLNQELPMYLGINRPTFILNAACGKQFHWGRWQLHVKAGIDYYLFYQLNRDVDYTLSYDAKSVFLYGKIQNRSKTGTFINPTVECNLMWTVKIKKKERFTIGYHLTYSYGFRQMQETTYEFLQKANFYSVINKNSGTYLANAFVITFPLKKKSTEIKK